ncbi:MAG: hypothetical protein ACM31G_00140 [Flavobacteriales bacterium]
MAEDRLADERMNRGGGEREEQRAEGLPIVNVAYFYGLFMVLSNMILIKKHSFLHGNFLHYQYLYICNFYH